MATQDRFGFASSWSMRPQLLLKYYLLSKIFLYIHISSLLFSLADWSTDMCCMVATIDEDESR